MTLSGLNQAFDKKSYIRVFLVLALFKLILISHSEIVTAIYDDGYATNSLYWFNHTKPAIENFQRPPGLPWLIMASRTLGLPYKTFLEILACSAIGLISCRLGTMIGSYLIGILLAALLILHPWFFEKSSYLLSEPPFLVVSLCWLTCISLLLEQKQPPGWKSPLLWCSGACLYLMDMIRLEDAIMVAFSFIAAAGISLAHTRDSTVAPKQWRFYRFRVAAICFIIPAFMIMGGKALVCLFNYEKCGVPSVCYLEAPGLVRLMQGLNDIQAPDPQRYSPITTRSVAMAMEVSPSFTLLKEYMKKWRPHSLQTTASFAQGEEGWILMWNIINSSIDREAANVTGPNSVKAINDYWNKCADEIQAGLRDGRLPRAAYAPYPINPNYSQWIDKYPSALVSTLGSLFDVHATPPGTWGLSSQGEFQVEGAMKDYLILNQAVSRRTSLLPYSYLEGYIYSRLGPVDDAFLETSGGQMLSTPSFTAPDLLPPDLAMRWSIPNDHPVRCRFSIMLPYAVDPDTRLVFVKNGQRVDAQTITDIISQTNAKPALLQNNHGGLVEISFADLNPKVPMRNWQEHLQNRIFRSYGLIEKVTLGLIFLLVLSLSYAGQIIPWNKRLTAFLGIMLGCLFIRCLFYSLVEAAVQPSAPRYPRALIMWTVIIACLLLTAFGSFLEKLVKNRRNRKSAG